MAKYSGRKGVVYLSTSQAGTASVISMATWSLNFATDKIDVTSFGDANKVYVQGLPDVSGSISGFWSHDDTKLFTAADSLDGCKLYLYPSADAAGIYFYGPAWVDASMEVGVSGAVSLTSNFSAAGSWGKKLA